MANYESLISQRELARKRKACFCVIFSMFSTVVIFGVLLTMLFWKPQPKALGFMNSTNYTERFRQSETIVDDAVIEIGNNTISFDVTVRLNLPSESKHRRSDDCDDAKAELLEICNNTIFDFQQCNRDKLHDFLENYLNENMQSKLVTRQDAHFSGIISTDVDIDIFNVKASSVDLKAKIAIAAPSLTEFKDSEEETKLQTIVESFQGSLQECPNFLTASRFRVGLDNYRAHEAFKKTEGFVGAWKLVSSERFDELLQHFGVNYFISKLAASQKPTATFAYNDDNGEWTLSVSSPMRTDKTRFTIGEEFVETMPDDRKLKTVVTVEKGKMIQTQRSFEGHVFCVITRELVNEDEQLVTHDTEVIISKRRFKRVK